MKAIKSTLRRNYNIPPEKVVKMLPITVDNTAVRHSPRSLRSEQLIVIPPKKGSASRELLIVNEEITIEAQLQSITNDINNCLISLGKYNLKEFPIPILIVIKDQVQAARSVLESLKVMSPNINK
jgi:hypothetical protein